jgi:hypothetical protein
VLLRGDVLDGVGTLAVPLSPPTLLRRGWGLSRTR